MRNYIILNGNNSNEITGLLIQSLPPISKPLMRTTIEEIDGRDGDIVTNLGYSAYDKEISIGLYGDYDVDEVIKYFHDNQKGQVVFSNEDDRYYNYEIIEQIDFERLIRFKTATVTLHCQPFKYDEDEEQIQVDATQVTGEGTDLTLEYTIQNASLALIPKGDTQQDSTTGKNIYDFTKSTSTSNSQTISANSYQILLNGKNTSASTFVFSTINLQAGTYTYQQSWDSGSIASGGVYQIQFYVNGTDIYNLRISTNYTNNYSYTFTLEESSTFQIRFYSAGSSPVDANNYKINVNIISGSTPDYIYEPYTNGASPNPSYPQPINVVTGIQELEICGKNRLNASQIYNYTIYTGSSTISPTTGRYAYLVKVKPNTKYTFSRSAVGTASLSYLVLLDDFINGQNNTYTSATNVGSNLTQTITTGANTKYVMFLSGSGESTDIQLEEGETASTYEAYTSQNYEINIGDIELCKIGTYQDYLFYNTPSSPYYNNELQDYKWYLHKEIGKVVLDGSEDENWSIDSTGTENYSYRCSVTGQTIPQIGLSNYFLRTNIANNNTNQGFDIRNYSSLFQIRIRYGTEDTLANYKTWLSTHNTTVYYVLATSTDTEITDSTLISQLDAILNAYCYQTTTNIMTSGDDLPIVVNATTSGMANTVVKNKGNIVAKPLMTIYGSGNIGVYFNEIQVIQIALGDESQITIDVANMEAYNQETLVLKNRLVTGDYNNMVLNTGDNEITFSGNVLGFTMDKYSRWL